jgi:tRNA-specific 2-thiouridylase
LKFEKLLARALSLGFDYLVTGHYARILKSEQTGRYRLARGVDCTKDQSYVLYMLRQEQLAHLLMPLGDLSKQEVRKLANQLSLKTANKPESQDICFVPDGNYAAWLAARNPSLVRPGDIVDQDGRKLGRHNGVLHYTIGQRKGIGIAASQPYYVQSINALTAEVVVCFEQGLYKDTAILNDVNLIEQGSVPKPLELLAAHRYGTRVSPASVLQTGEDELTVTFATPEKALTPGQALVLYNKDFVFGGGTIVRTS